jgi:hypothetical protein
MAVPTRTELHAEVDRQFRERHPEAPEKLEKDDPGHASLVEAWLEIRDTVVNEWTDKVFFEYFPTAGKLDPKDSGDKQLIEYWLDIRDQIRDDATPRYTWAGPGGGLGSGPSSGAPPHVTDFEAILKKTLFLKDPVIQAVTVEDLTPKFHFFDLGKTVRGIYKWLLYGAWTDSATKIFVREVTIPGLTSNDVHDQLAITAFHEAVHLRDFARTGRPQTYAQMLEYEAKAYDATRTWLNSNQAKKLLKNDDLRVGNRDASDIYAKAIKAEIARVNKLPVAAREAAFKDFLMGKNTIRTKLRDAELSDEAGESELMLPPHSQIADLYGP